MKSRAAESRSAWSLLRFVEGLVLSGFVLYAAKPVLFPLVLAVLLSFVLAPIVGAVQRCGLSRVPAVLGIVGLAFFVLGLVGWATTVQVRNLAAELPEHKKEIRHKIESLRGLSDGAVSGLLQMIRDLDDQPDEADEQSLAHAVVIASPPPDSSLASVFNAVAPVFEPLATVGLVIVLVIFMLINREDLRDRIIELTGQRRLAGTTRMFGDTAQRLSQYLLTQLFVNVGFGLAFGIMVWLTGVPFAFLWGLLTALLRFVPYVGTWLAAALPVLLSVALFPGWLPSLGLLASFLVLDLVTANVIEPLLLGRHTGVTPVALLVAAAFWTWLWGPVGLVLSTPLTVCLVVLGQHVPRFKFLSVLLGGEPTVAPHVRYYQRLLAGDTVEARQRAVEYARAHGLEAAYDQVVIPALRLARRDRGRQELSIQEEEFVYTATSDILDALAAAHAAPVAVDLPPARRQLAAAQAPASAAMALKTGSAGEAGGDIPPQIRAPAAVLACPGHHVSEELILKMFEQLVARPGLAVEIASSKALPSAIVNLVEQSSLAVVFIAVLPPGGLPQASYLAQLLREQFPQIKIVVGYWGADKHFDRVLVRLRAAGVSYVTTSLVQSRSQVEYLAGVS